ncbi:unnamed protein product [Gadus morhua 'NCC']
MKSSVRSLRSTQILRWTLWQRRAMSTRRTAESLHSRSIFMVQRHTNTSERLDIFPSHIHKHYKGGCVRWMPSLA